MGAFLWEHIRSKMKPRQIKGCGEGGGKGLRCVVLCMQTFFYFFNMIPKLGSLIYFSDSIEPEGPILLSTSRYWHFVSCFPPPLPRKIILTLALSWPVTLLTKGKGYSKEMMVVAFGNWDSQKYTFFLVYFLVYDTVNHMHSLTLNLLRLSPSAYPLSLSMPVVTRYWYVVTCVSKPFACLIAGKLYRISSLKIFD